MVNLHSAYMEDLVACFPDNAWLSLQTADGRQAVPLALIGSGLGGDCAPKAANFRQVANNHQSFPCIKASCLQVWKSLLPGPGPLEGSSIEMQCGNLGPVAFSRQWLHPVQPAKCLE